MTRRGRPPKPNTDDVLGHNEMIVRLNRSFRDDQVMLRLDRIEAAVKALRALMMARLREDER